MLRIELTKAFGSKTFYVSLAITVIMTVASGIISVYAVREMREIFIRNAAGGVLENPWLPAQSVNRQWIAEYLETLLPNIYYLLIPLTSAFAYAWSFSSERKSGYEKNVLTRTTKSRYYFSKLTAVFLSGAVIVFISMLANLIAVSLVLPFRLPDASYEFQYARIYGNYLSELYFTNPVVYFSFELLTAALYGGLYSSVVLSFSYIIKNTVVSVVTPFLLAVMFNFIESFFDLSNIGELSPLKFLYSGAGNLRVSWIIFTEAVLLLLFSIAMTFWMCRSKDVL